MTDVTLMPIGRFAAASRLSVKSLRNYDKSGLLPAAHIDPQSGYRYYRLQQLAQAQVIRTLRILDMPLAQIADIVGGKDTDGLLESHLAALIRQRDDYDKKVAQLQSLRSRREIIMSQEVSIKTVGGGTYLAYRTITSYAGVFEAIPAGFGRVLGFCQQHDIEPAGAPITIFHCAPEADSDGDISLAVPIGGLVHGLDDDLASAELVQLEIPDGPVASVVHEGSYDSMGDSYATIAGWILNHGHTQAGPGREIYLNSPADVPENELRTEIQWPIEE